MKWLISSWRGEERLWKVFWIYGPSILPLAFYVVFIVFPLEISGAAIISYSHFFLAWTCFNCWLVVSLWRCSANTSDWLWKRLARLYALLIAVQIIMFVWSGGFTDPSEQNRATMTCKTILAGEAKKQHREADDYINQHRSDESACVRNIIRTLR